jgi:UDP-GlcNAc3NAcA epimerase
LTPKSFVLATIHRAENTDHPDRLVGIMAALKQIAKEIPVVLPLHPRTRKCLENMGVSCNDAQNSPVRFVDPVGYLDMVMLEKNARVIITDSGGVQKEAYFHGVPCVTVREETEWVELVEAGVNRLVPTEKESIVVTYQKLKDQKIGGKKFYGGGDSAVEIVKFLRSLNIQ